MENLNATCGTVDDYSKLEYIGSGSFGVVHKVQDKKTELIFALKTIKVKDFKGHAIPNACNEVEMLKIMQHENIVKFFGIVQGRSERKIYLLLEYCEETLGCMIEKVDYPLPQAEIKCIMLQLFSALDYVHSHGIIHRDINPTNLLLKNYSILKICDFGAAKSKLSRPLSPRAGTLWYQSLELLLASEWYSTAVDIWAAGCIFAEILTQVPLFPGDTEMEQINLIINLLGTPNEETMPGYSQLPVIRKFELKVQPSNHLNEKFCRFLNLSGIQFLQKMLAYSEEMRITAKKCFDDEYFQEEPKACSKKQLKTSLCKMLELPY